MTSNFHASAIIVADRGVLVAGPSGSGKTSLCVALLALGRTSGFAARLVSDDQALLRSAGGRLIASAPPAIAGLVEIRGFGPAPLATEQRMVADLLVRLVAADRAPRIAGDESEVLAGIAVPRLTLAAGDPQMAARAVAAFLRLSPFAG